MKSWIAAALIIVPLLIAAAVRYWPHTPAGVSIVAIAPPKLYGSDDLAVLGDKITVTLAMHLKEVAGLQVKLSSAETADVLVVTSLTSDSGLLQLDIQAIDRRTHKEIWQNAYQSPQARYSEMLEVAAEGLRRALDQP